MTFFPSLHELDSSSMLWVWTLSIGAIITVAAAGRRIVKKVHQRPSATVRLDVLASPTSGGLAHFDSLGLADSDDSNRAYGDELLHERRLRERYLPRLKHAWLQTSRDLFSRARRRKDRASRQMEDGLESIYTPVKLPMPRAFLRQQSSDQPCGFNLEGIGLMAFSAIMDSWKVFGGRDVPLLVEMCQSALLVERGPGEYLFQEGDAIGKCVHVLQEGELEISVSSEGAGSMPSGEAGHRDVLAVVKEPGSIVTGLMDLLAHLTAFPDPEYCVTARCVSACKIIQVPISIQDSPRLSEAQTICRLIRSCLTRVHRVTLLTAYFYLGIIFDRFPRHPVTQLPPELADVGEARMLSERHQEALKAVVRAVLGLDNDFQLPDLEASVLSLLTSSSPRPPFSTPSSPMGTPRSFSSLRPLSPSSQRTAQQQQQIKVLTMRTGEGLYLDELSRTSMHIVLSGYLEVTVASPQQAGMGKSLFSGEEDGPGVAKHGPGTVLGYGLLLTGTPEEYYCPRGRRSAPLQMTAGCLTALLVVPQALCDAVMKRNYLASTMLAARQMLHVVPRILRVVDFGVQWRQLHSGQVLVKEGEASHGCVYVLLYGRVRLSVRRKDGAGRSSTGTGGGGGQPSLGVPVSRVKILSDHGRGTLIGEGELLTGGTYKATVQALRYSSFATIPSSMLSLLVRRHPRVLSTLVQHVCDKAALSAAETAGASPHAVPSLNQRRTTIGLEDAKTVLVLPVSMSVPLDLFCQTLEAALLKARHSVRILSSGMAQSMRAMGDSFVLSAGDPTSEDPTGHAQQQQQEEVDFLLESWLTQIEEHHEIVLFQADWQESEWNRLAAATADVVLLVANANDKPQISVLETMLQDQLCNALKYLILLHVNPGPYYTPSGTRRWIEKRRGINQHYHMRLHTHSPQYDQSHIRSDFSRLARILTGTAVGLVLGGGGARGMAHLGLLRVLEEEGVPVDFIVGCSVGSLVGGLYASKGSYLDIVSKVNRFTGKLSNAWLFLRDATLPYTSYFNGYSFGRALEKALGETKIEDCWLSFACVTVDLSVSRERVHQNGTLWRYVRASMTLAGFLPPMCDVASDDTVHYLVDGGYVNNVPADVLKERFPVETVIACDVGVEVVLTGREDYGDTLHGLRVLWSMLPWSKSAPKVPTMGEISSQLMYVRSVEQLAHARERFIDFYITTEIAAVGYKHAKEQVKAWKALRRGGRSRLLRQERASELELRRGRSLNSLHDE